MRRVGKLRGQRDCWKRRAAGLGTVSGREERSPSPDLQGPTGNCADRAPTSQTWGGGRSAVSLGGDQWAGERLPRAERTLTSVAGEEGAGQTRGSRTLTRVWGAASVRGRRLGDGRYRGSSVRRGHRDETLEPSEGTPPPPGLVKRRREDVVLCSESYFLQGTRGLLQLCWMET